MIVVAAALVGGLRATLSDGSIIAWMLGAAVIAPIFLLIWTGLTLLIGKMFGGQATFMGLLRSLGYASAPGAAQVIPILGWLLSLWWLVTGVVAVRESHRISTGQAVGTVVIGVVILVVIIVILFILLGALLATVFSLS